MQIQTHCQCGAKYAFSSEQVGHPFRCSVCHQVFNVPPPGQKPVMHPIKGQMDPAQQPKQVHYHAPPARSGGGIGTCLMVLLILGAVMVGFTMLMYTGFSRVVSSMPEWKTEFDNNAQASKRVNTVAARKALIEDFQGKGYELEDSQTSIAKIDGEPLNRDKLFACHLLELSADSNANIAVVSQSATLKGNVKGNVDFMGQMLVIDKDAVIDGNLNLVFSQVVDVRGKVKGKLTGRYHVLKGRENVEGEIESDGTIEAMVNDIVKETTSRKVGVGNGVENGVEVSETVTDTSSPDADADADADAKSNANQEASDDATSDAK